MPANHIESEAVSRMVTRRRLDHIEMVLRESAPSFVVEYSGLLSDEMLRRAWAIECSRHALLRAKLYSSDDGCWLTLPNEHQAEIYTACGEVSDLRELCQAAWPEISSGDVARLIHLKAGFGGFLALRVNHAVFDGVSLGFMFRDLWETVKLLTEGHEPVYDVDRCLPRAPSAVLEENDIGAIFAIPSIDAASLEWSKEIEHDVVLAELDSSRLFVAVRRYDVSVHSVVSAAISLALKLLDKPHGNGTMTCWSTVDLRARMPRSSLRYSDVTQLTAFHRGLVSFADGDQLFVLADQIKTQLTDDLAHGLIEMNAGAVASPGDGSLPRRVARFLITNVGVISQLPPIPGVEVCEVLRGFYEGQSTLVDFPAFVVSTYDEVLKIVCRFPSLVFTQQESEWVSGQIYRLLLDVTSHGLE